MGKKKRGLVDNHKLSERKGNAQSYERYIAQSLGLEDTEDVRANPDSLPEYDTAPSTPKLLMGEAVLHLQGRQREVYLLVMRENRSFADVGEILDISKSSVQTYLDRAIAFVTAYCVSAMERGRV